MRKLIFFLVLVNNVYSQTDFIQSVINLNGNVKARTVEECEVSYKFGNIVKDRCHSGVDLFDGQGKILEAFGTKKTLIEWPHFFDLVFSGDDGLGMTFRLSYDNLNYISTTSLGRYVNGVYDMSQFFKYTRDDNERLIREEFFNADGILTEVVNYKYDESNNLRTLKTIEFDLVNDDFGEVVVLDSLSYGVTSDGKNYVTSNKVYYNGLFSDTTYAWTTRNGKIDSSILWSDGVSDLKKKDENSVTINHYDKDGILNLRVYRHYVNGVLDEESQTTYTYYENGFLKKQESSQQLIEYDCIFDDMGNPVEVLEKRNGKPWLMTTYTYEYEE